MSESCRWAALARSNVHGVRGQREDAGPDKEQLAPQPARDCALHRFSPAAAHAHGRARHPCCGAMATTMASFESGHQDMVSRAGPPLCLTPRTATLLPRDRAPKIEGLRRCTTCSWTTTAAGWPPARQTAPSRRALARIPARQPIAQLALLKAAVGAQWVCLSERADTVWTRQRSSIRAAAAPEGAGVRRRPSAPGDCSGRSAGRAGV
jgi:hypothetical protein